MKQMKVMVSFDLELAGKDESEKANIRKDVLTKVKVAHKLNSLKEPGPVELPESTLVGYDLSTLGEDATNACETLERTFSSLLGARGKVTHIAIAITTNIDAICKRPRAARG